MIQSDLEALGLTEEESKVYMASLELGGGYVSAIAGKSRVNRVACYYTLDKLVKKGLLTQVTKNKIQYFAPENPHVLVNQMEDKWEKAKEMLPDLLALTHSLAYKPKIRYYEGEEGVRTIFEETLSAKNEIVGYTNLEIMPDIVSARYIRDYAKRKIDAGIKTRMLSPLTPQALKYLKRYYPENYDRRLTEILFVNPAEFPFEYEINIYDDFVSVVSLSRKERVGLIMESPLYAKTQRSVFNLAWLGATSFVAR